MNKKRLAAVFLSAVAVVWTIHYTTNHWQFGSIKGHTIPAKEGPSALVRSLRPSYPYSIIAGGAYSRPELQYANSRDSVVRAHYADFNVATAKLVTLTDDRYQYVSYRLKDQVYWTKRKLRIPKGELLLTDRQNFARARCGNRLSDKPHSSATNAHEPDSALLSLPPVNRDILPGFQLAKEPALGGIAAETPAITAGSGAVPLPTEMAASNSGKAVVPFEPLWGGGPIIGGGVVAGAPLIGSNGSPGSPGTPTTSSTPQTPTTPVTITGTPPPDVTTVPEPKPSSIYLFLISLGVSVWALLRMVPKDEKQKQK